MIADITIEESIAVFGKRGRTTAKDVIKALSKLGIACGNSLIRIKEKKKPSLCMVVLHFEGEKDTHWTVYYRGLYYDPAAGIGDTYHAGIRETSYLWINTPIRESRGEAEPSGTC